MWPGNHIKFYFDFNKGLFNSPFMSVYHIRTLRCMHIGYFEMTIKRFGLSTEWIGYHHELGNVGKKERKQIL